MFKSYSSKASATKGATRAGIHSDMVIQVDGKWGYEVHEAEPTVQELGLVPEATNVAEQQTVTPATNEPAAVADAPQGSTRSVEKNRPTQNGVTRPSAGGKCRTVWDECDKLVAAGSVPNPTLLKAWAEANGYNPNNAQIELYQWRKYHGITGRVKVAPPVTDAATQPTA